MKKTEQVNIGGYAFSVDSDSYNLIRSYLDGLTAFYANSADGAEIVDGIEERMAELLLDRCGEGTVVSAADADYVIRILGTPQNFAEEGGGQPGMPKAEPVVKKRLYRDISNKQISGVCSGLAAYLHLDVFLIRLIFVLLFLGSFALDEAVFIVPLAYFILAFIMPKADNMQKMCELKGEGCSYSDVENQLRSQKVKPSQPAGSALGRILGIIVGSILFISGLSFLFGGAALFAIPAKLTGLSDVMAEITEKLQEYFNFGSLPHFRVATIVFAAISYAMPCLISIYAGILLIFKLKSPKWHPGIIMLLIWIAAIVGLAFLLTGDLLEIGRFKLFDI